MALSGSKRTLEDRTNRLKGLLCQFGSHQFTALQAKAIKRLFNLRARYGGAKKAAFKVDYFVGRTEKAHRHAASERGREGGRERGGQYGKNTGGGGEGKKKIRKR